MTVLVNDDFNGTESDGDDLNGATPSPTNTPGDTWASGVDGVEFDGNDQVKTTAADEDARIDCGDVDIYVSIEHNGGGADNRGIVHCRGSDLQWQVGAKDAYFLNWRASTIHLFKQVNASNTQLGSDISFTITNTTTYKYGISSIGTSIKAWVDDDEKGERTDSAIDGTTEGGQFGGFNGQLHTDAAGRYDNFIADDALPGATATVAILRRRYEGY